MQIQHVDVSSAVHGETVTGDYWRRLFTDHPQFSSWQLAKQEEVKRHVFACLGRGKGRRRVLDYGIGNLGLYRSMDARLLGRLEITGISESSQYAADDVLLKKSSITVLVGDGARCLASIPSASQDSVVSTYVFDYLPADSHAALLREFARVLVPAGEMILVFHHPQGARNRKFRLSEHYWTQSLAVYRHILAGKNRKALELLAELYDYREKNFADEPRYNDYLAAYARTAINYLGMFAVGDGGDAGLAAGARADCAAMIDSIRREYAMTAGSFRPVEMAEFARGLPDHLRLHDVVVCRDPANGQPIATFCRILMRR